MPTTLSARAYHERTKHSRAAVRSGEFRLDWSNEPPTFKAYEGTLRVGLADGFRPSLLPSLRAVAEAGRDPLPRDHPDVGGPRPVDLDALTQLCYLSAGVTRVLRRGGRPHHYRAASCTGARYHVELYLVTGEVPPAPWNDGDGLDPGVYHFDPATLSLDVVREGDYRGVLASASGEYGPVADAPITAVATSEWYRNAWKYRARTYRHAFWDAGTVLANLLATAHGLDLPAEVVTGFADSRVADLLGVAVDREAPLALVPVGAGVPVPESPTAEDTGSAAASGSSQVVDYPEIRDAYRGSALDTGDGARAWRDGRPAGEGVGLREPGDGDRVPLDSVGDDRAAKTPVYHTVRRRGSARTYARTTLNRRKVATVLDRATRSPPMDCRDLDGPALQYNDCYLVVNAVEGVPSGAYQYHPDAGELEPLRRGQFRADARRLALDQDLAGDAAVCAFFLTDLDAVTDRLGDRGYRVAQLEAALSVGRLYLATYAHRDLGATGLTFYDDEVTAFFGPRADGQTPTLCWTLGRPA